MNISLRVTPLYVTYKNWSREKMTPESSRISKIKVISHSTLITRSYLKTLLPTVHPRFKQLWTQASNKWSNRQVETFLNLLKIRTKNQFRNMREPPPMVNTSLLINFQITLILVPNSSLQNTMKIFSAL